MFLCSKTLNRHFQPHVLVVVNSRSEQQVGGAFVLTAWPLCLSWQYQGYLLSPHTESKKPSESVSISVKLRLHSELCYTCTDFIISSSCHVKYEHPPLERYKKWQKTISFLQNVPALQGLQGILPISSVFDGDHSKKSTFSIAGFHHHPCNLIVLQCILSLCFWPALAVMNHITGSGNWALMCVHLYVGGICCRPITTYMFIFPVA